MKKESENEGEMNIGVALFSYNRADSTRAVLEALRKNRVIPEKLYLFRDGPKNEEDREKCICVDAVLNEVDWCKTEHIYSETNKGLADSIIDGVTRVLNDCEAIIVIEDDCVTHAQFMEFMIEALNLYKNRKEVFSVSGYGEPVQVSKDDYDAYFTGRISSWGWGTWRDRWNDFHRDYGVLRRIKRNKELFSELMCWGEDLEDMFLASASARNDSWAVLWALHVIERKGFNLAPYESLVDNIGFDGRGTHSGNVKPSFFVQEGIRKFTFPKEIVFRPEIKIAISEYYSKAPRIVKEVLYKEFMIKLYRMRQRGRLISEVLNENNIKTTSIFGKNEITGIVIEDCKEVVDIKEILLSKAVEESDNSISIKSYTSMDISVDAVVVIPYFDYEKIQNKLKQVGYKGRVISIIDLIE